MAEAESAAREVLPPSETLYIQNLNERVKLPGVCTHASPF